MEIRSKDIKIVSVKELKQNPNNRNHHPQDQIERLAKVIKYQGFRNPLIVSNQTGFIVAGHGRFLAAIRAGLKEVPVIFQDFESPEQEYAYGVSDNAVSLWAELDLTGINNDLQDLDGSFDIDNLGIKNFTLDFNEKEFDPDLDEEDDDDSDSKSIKTCPHCGEEL